MNNKPSRMTPFILGLILGILGMIYLPDFVRPRLPEWVTGKPVVVKGIVTAKQKKDDVLLLTLDTPEGALLASFKKKVDETSLLVNEKDVIEFTLPKYMPFLEDPKIIRVSKDQPASPVPAPAAAPAEKSAKETKSPQRRKPKGVVTLESTTATKPLEPR